jgi:hypothetical protein
VIVQRWQKFTGGWTALDGGGRAFDDLKSNRAVLTNA